MCGTANNNNLKSLTQWVYKPPIPFQIEQIALSLSRDSVHKPKYLTHYLMQDGLISYGYNNIFVSFEDMKKKSSGQVLGETSL